MALLYWNLLSLVYETSTSKSPVTERTLKLSLLHDSVILFNLFNESSALFRENPPRPVCPIFFHELLLLRKQIPTVISKHCSWYIWRIISDKQVK